MFRPLAAAIPLALTLSTLAASSHATTTTGPTITSVGTVVRPGTSGGPTDWFNRPSLASARLTVNGTATTRFFRSVNIGSKDDLAYEARQTTYRDAGTPTWHPVAFDKDGAHATFANFVQDASGLVATDKIAFLSSRARGEFHLQRRTSTNGLSWATSTSTVHLGAYDPSHATKCFAAANSFAYQGIIKLADGTWAMPVYYKYYANCAAQSDVTYAVALVTSQDRGANWWVAATPFANTGLDYSEATVAQLPDGRLEMIARRNVRGTLLGQLTFRFSTQAISTLSALKATSWTWPVIAIPGSPIRGNLTLGVSPRLTRVGTRMVLTYGRPGNRLTWSTDGVHWASARQLASNLPSGNCVNSSRHEDCRALGASGYTGVVATGPNDVMIATDNCHNWSCEKPGQNWPDVYWPAGGNRQLLRFWHVTF